jgi:hypothetical protein
MRVITMSRSIAALAVLALASACTDTSGPNPPPEPGNRLTVVPRTATIHAGQAMALKAKLTGERGEQLEGVTVAWKSSNESVASVSTHGNVFGRGEGFAVITATAHDAAQTSTIHVLRRSIKPDTRAGVDED